MKRPLIWLSVVVLLSSFAVTGCGTKYKIMKKKRYYKRKRKGKKSIIDKPCPCHSSVFEYANWQEC